ncbi:MAG TPA: response regulator transcription factor [Synergistales bacterium]|nr:response regulator transcription factor [Synergistales bacterium]
MITLMICEDVKDVREGLRYLLGMEEEIHVLEAVSSAEDLFLAIQKCGQPDIVLMDIVLPGISGIEATERIKRIYPEIRVLILTIFEEEEKILSAIQAGATGYILKNTRPGEVVSQIKALHSGGSPISPNVARVLLDEFRKDNTSRIKEDYRLTPREKEIMKGIIQGYTYREIADQCNIASSTVKKHILHIYKKLEVNSKVEFIKKVMNWETDQN